MSFTPTIRIFARDGSNFWSCLRRSSNNAWYASGSYGFFNNNNMYSSYAAIPLSNYLKNQNDYD